MTPEEIVEDSEFHKMILGNYKGPYSLGVGASGSAMPNLPRLILELPLPGLILRQSMMLFFKETSLELIIESDWEPPVPYVNEKGLREPDYWENKE